MHRVDTRTLEDLARLIRHWILASTTEAGSGHPSSCLSSVELMVTLFFSGILKADIYRPKHPSNDRVIFSKGHAAPLLYALYAAAGVISEKELMTLRKFTSPLEGHPSPHFPQVEAATGSLGQGLSIGLGMALAARLDHLQSKIYVLLGDGEMAEGSNWEAIQVAAHYKLGNLVGILDVNRFGQSGETMLGHEPLAYADRIASFGWTVYAIDGHNFKEILQAYTSALDARQNRPTMLIAKTYKGKGVTVMEDRSGWHGKVLSEEQLKRAVVELGPVDSTVRGTIAKPDSIRSKPSVVVNHVKRERPVHFSPDTLVATRKAFGKMLSALALKYPNCVVLDADMKKSTFTEEFSVKYRKRFFQMYISEQNMVSAALGLSLRGKIPIVSTFAAFFTRAFDQIRMASYSHANIKFVGSHVGVSIGQDGPSQMGLEDIAMFRSVHDSIVLYPSDAVSCSKLVEESIRHDGIVYLRTTRKVTPVIYVQDESFPIAGSKTVKQSDHDYVTVIAAGVTLHEALAAYASLVKDGIRIRVIDLYSVKPVDASTVRKAAQETKAIVVVEDHHPEGGIADAVRSVLSEFPVPVHSLAVRKEERSGKPEELLDYEDISAIDIIAKVKEIII